MLFAVLFGLVVSTGASSWYNPWGYHDYDDQRYPYDYDYGFPRETFWDRFERNMEDFSRRMEKVADNIKPNVREKIDGNEYKITIQLPGFNKEDIVVRAKRGRLVVRAVHDVPGEPSNNYMDVRDLPVSVGDNGRWTYNCGVLKIVFPITRQYSPAESTTINDFTEGTEEPVTEPVTDDDIRGDVDKAISVSALDAAGDQNQNINADIRYR